MSPAHFPLDVRAALLIMLLPLLCCSDDPTNGCTQHHYGFIIQKPYNVPVYQRYNVSDGVQTFWVYSDDKPHDPESRTEPRTELRFLGVDYSTGVWQFDAEIYVPSGTTGTCVMQIHPTLNGYRPVTLVDVNQGELTAQSSVLAADIYDHWFRLNVVHDADRRLVSYYVNGNHSVTKTARLEKGPLYFKCGVYAQANPSHLMVSRFRNIKMWKC